MIVNNNFANVKESYLFSEIAKRIEEFKSRNPKADVIKLGIGDVTQPLPEVCIRAMHEAVDEMAHADTFRGYGPEQGYDFLRNAIAENDFKARGCDITADEIFVSDGAKSDTANFTDLFGKGNIIGISNPVYPVYLDSNILAGNTGAQTAGGYQNIRYLNCIAENDFKPQIPQEKLDIVYLCSPNNPTGVAMTYQDMKAWVDYALKNNTLILFDAAYESFIRQEGIPHSIYEIPDARKVAVEFRSYSKTAGFTGVRCAYTVVPKTLTVTVSDSPKPLNLHSMWLRRQTTKFNGASYIVQRGAAALYSESGRIQIRKTIDIYLQNAMLIRKTFEDAGYKVWGADNSPYIWLKVPDGQTSWEFFDYLLNNYNIVGTPGSGFGTMGEGHFRLTGFGSISKTQEAANRIKRGQL
jgi:LL-diaminopimelate aminotransferase